MKKSITLFCLAAIIFLFIAPVQSFGQTADTIWIKAHPIGNINNVINGDTTSTGARNNPNRVYALYRDSVYLFTTTISVNSDFKIFGAPGTGRPPVIAPSILSDNSSPNLFFNLTKSGSKASFKNIYLLNVRPDQVMANIGGGSGIQAFADSVRLTVDSCYFDAMGGAAVIGSGAWDKLFVSDCVFRNSQHPSAWFNGSAVFDEKSDVDTVVVVNNSFFYMGAYAYVIVGYNSFFKFEHNTVFLNMVNPLNIFMGTNVDIENNIFFATEAPACDSSLMSQQYYENYALTSGIISLDTAISGLSPAVSNKTRIAKVNNNSYFWPSFLTDFYTAYNDTVTKMETVNGKTVRGILYPSVWMNSFTAAMFNDPTNFPGLSQKNNVNVDPGFNATVQSQFDKALAYIIRITEGNSTDNSLWQFLPTSGVLFPPTWPLPENLSYSNTTLQTAGTDGLPLGDLNWYPAQHQQYLTDVKVDKGTKVPTTFSLSNAYPNPFNPTTNIQFNIAKSENIKLVVFNILGQQVKTLVNGEMKAGSYTATWNGKDEFGNSVASGIYFYRLESQSFNTTKKMILMK
ncbi:MAG: T9SS type A sorting domain-containing protein [Ignavibacteriaceae bacterium]|nr:T9SS type A sorting domain-containing protein [Ignavibacteriaceae bacterium]